MQNYPKKLNIGCGFDKREGFLNVDLNAFHDPDLIADVCNLSMLPSGAFDYILAQDVLEHLEREKSCVALREWSRLLSPNGCLEIRVPSLLGMFELLSKPENRAWENAEKIIHLMYGTQKYNGDYHLAGFTAEILVEYLRRSGLVVRRAIAEDDWLFDIEAVKEGQLRTPEELIHNAYFQILGRPADQGGLEAFSQRVQCGAMTIQDVCIELIDSNEYQVIQTKPIYFRNQI